MRDINQEKKSPSIMNFFYNFKKFLKILFRGGRPREVKWNKQYNSGKWDYLKNLDELAHYSIIIGYFNFFKPKGSILDVGCGEGVIQDRLGQYQYSKYVGIDGSKEAVKRASGKNNEKTFFIQADMKDYSPEEAFDVIIFNEILYYLKTPLKLIKKYEKFLDKNGIFIISMYKPIFPLSLFINDIWKKIEKEYKLIDETAVANKLGHKWVCRVYIPF